MAVDSNISAAAGTGVRRINAINVSWVILYNQLLCVTCSHRVSIYANIRI